MHFLKTLGHFLKALTKGKKNQNQKQERQRQIHISVCVQRNMTFRNISAVDGELLEGTGNDRVKTEVLVTT